MMATSLKPEDDTSGAASACSSSSSSGLPVFSLNEMQLRKAADRNCVAFAMPVHSSVLLQLARPPPRTHRYEERDHRWLHLLEAVAVVPSRKMDVIQKLVTQALQLLPSPVYKKKLERCVRVLLATLEQDDASMEFSKRALVALEMKDRVAQFLREWVADPIEGFVLRKDHVVAGLRLDDLVATPVGAGYLRGYRSDDGFCIVLYPWGYGFIHVKCVSKLDDAIVAERTKKRKFNEYLPLEHQHLYEDIESLLENYPPEEGQSAKEDELVLTPDGVNVAEYKKLLDSLEEEHFNADVLQHDLSFVRRVHALAVKTRHEHEHQHDEQDDEEDDGDNENENEYDHEAEDVKDRDQDEASFAMAQ
ncbi:hypothetical protein FI667_g6355, partial [Globisporangium splendens]